MNLYPINNYYNITSQLFGIIALATTFSNVSSYNKNKLYNTYCKIKMDKYFKK